MKICPECGRNYGDDAIVCAYDGFALSSGTTSAWTGEKAGPPEAGDVLGVYRILGQIAEGGMGVIFRAEHVRLGRQVALKVLKPELACRTDIVRRFFEEARAVNEIGHPNIVDVIDFVEVSDQDPPLVYMVMELLVGEDLANRVRGAGPLEPEEAVRIACQVCDALIAVHRVKILHRDLKPENIFLINDEDSHRVKLLDFGVAKAFGERQRVNLTDPGTAIGTPEYMAPEQILGKELDERTDIYALGLVLYDMLTNSVPFQASKYGELLVAQVKETPEPVSRRRREGTPVPPALEAAVMRCLQKKQVDRFQNARELKEALLVSIGAAAEASIGVGTESLSLSPPRLPRRTPWVPVALGAGALLAGFVTVWLVLGEKTRAPVVTARPDARASHPRVTTTSPPDGPGAPDSAVAAGAADAGVSVVRSGPKPPKRRARRPGRRERADTVARPRAKPPEAKAPEVKAKGKRGRAGIEGTLDPFAQ